jgi:Prephenate dehydratase
MSHEQVSEILLDSTGCNDCLAKALGQCQTFIASHFPSASLTKTTSTAAAAQALLDNPPDCAAICSRICGTLFHGLSVLQEGIQDDAGVFHAANAALVTLISVYQPTLPVFLSLQRTVKQCY